MVHAVLGGLGWGLCRPGWARGEGRSGPIGGQTAPGGLELWEGPPRPLMGPQGWQGGLTGRDKASALKSRLERRDGANPAMNSG